MTEFTHCKHYDSEDNELKGPLDGATHVLTIFDENWYVVYFESAEHAQAYVMLNTFNVAKTPEFMAKNYDKLPSGSYVFEHDGKLYHNWITYGKTGKYDLLFSDYTEEKPTTLDGLEKYIKEGNPITLGWSSRVSTDYLLLPIDKARERFDKRNKDWESDEYDFEFFA